MRHLSGGSERIFGQTTMFNRDDKLQKSLDLILQVLKEHHVAMQLELEMVKALARHVDKMEEQYQTLFQYILGKTK